MADNEGANTNAAQRTYRDEGSFVWVTIAALVYASDFFLTHFKGINTNQFWSALKTTGIEGLTRKGSFLGIVILLFVIWYFFRKPEDREELISRIPLIFLITSLFTFGYLFDPGVIVHILLASAILFFMMYPVEENKARANLLMLVFIFVDFFLFSIIQLNKLIIPVWVIAALIYAKRSNIKSIIAWILFFVYFFHFFSVVNVYNMGPDYLTGKDYKDFTQFLSNVRDNAKTFVTSMSEGYKRQKNITQAMVFGDYYTSQVDQNVQQQLGVSIIEIKSADPDVYEDEPLIVYARLRARTLKDEITIKNFCHAESILPDSIKPATQNISQYEELTIDCMFNKCRFSPGSKTIYFNHAFGFQTLSYLRNYFIDRERMQAMIREDPKINMPVDVLRNIGVYDTSPIALSTNGPIKIGMELEKSQPVSIDRKRDIMSFRLGITLENIWEGKIKDVKDLVIILPKEMSLELDGGASGTYCGGYMFNSKTCATVFGEEGEWCNDAESNIFQIDQAGKNQNIIPAGQPGISLYKSLICRLSMDKNNYDNFLGTAPVAIKNFKVIADYEYEFQRSISVNIQKSQYDGCKGEQTSEDIEEQECKAFTADKNDLPSAEFLERYKNYQNNVKSIVKTYRPRVLNDVKSESLIAAIMSEASEMGKEDKNENKIPDYVADFGIKYPEIFLDAPIKNIESAAKFLKETIDKETAAKEDDKIKSALEKYKLNNGLEEFDVNNVMKYYKQWQNKLCKGEETKTEEETKEAAVPISTLFKQNDLIGEDKDNNMQWTATDEYYFIKGFKKGTDGSWVYLLNYNNNPLLEQMKIDTFDYYRNLHSGSYNVMVQRPAAEPAAWDTIVFNPNMDLKNGVVR